MPSRNRVTALALFYKLSAAELATYLLDLQHDLSSDQRPIDDVAANYTEPAQLEFPLGEITNPKISRLILIWQSQGAIQIGQIGPRDRFDAQGLEGKCIIPTTLLMALLATRELPPYRRAVNVSPNNSPNHRKGTVMSHKTPPYWVDALVNIREELVAAERGENRGLQDPALTKAANQSSNAASLPSSHPVVSTNPPSAPVSTRIAGTRRWSLAAPVLRLGQAIKHLMVVIVVLGIALLVASFLAAYRRIAAQTT